MLAAAARAHTPQERKTERKKEKKNEMHTREIWIILLVVITFEGAVLGKGQAEGLGDQRVDLLSVSHLLHGKHVAMLGG